MKKKLVMYIAVIALVAVIASAALVQYFGQRETTIDVVLPIEVFGDGPETLTGVGCGHAVGSVMTVFNKADFPIDVSITSSEEEGVTTTYKATLELSQKVVNFSDEGPWELTGDTASVSYTIVGDSFDAEVITGEKDGYELIYYKDNSDRFNNPAEAITVASITGNLPHANDGNVDEYDYCATGEYATCHGAKIWYVPSNAITDDELDWNRASEFLFETELIQYNHEGVITMYPDNIVGLYSVFDFDCRLNGQVVITTEIDMVE